MTVQKLTYPSKENAVQEKINEIIDNLGGGGGSVDIDNLSITENASNQLQTVGVINQNNTSTAIKTWTGTKAQYDAIVSKDSNTLYNVTDDVDISLPILEVLYPVGSIYITTANTCPLVSLISGSTWELVSSGRVLQGADSNHAVGTTAEAGLPNISGSMNLHGSGGANIIDGLYGAFTGLGGSTTNYRTPSDLTSKSGAGSQGGFNFSAQNSNSIYGNSSTVQPPAYFVNIYRRTA